MIIIETLPLLRQHIQNLRQKGKRIALVPTMGNLHDGHIKLVNEAKRQADVVIASIFVNPIQFDQANDLTRYPRTLQEDYSKLHKCHLDCLFLPSEEVIYPKGIKGITYVEVPNVSAILEGAARPGHFRGVSTIISKLFNLVQPDLAYFGEKDFQQLMLVRKMVDDLNYNITIIGVPTVRAKDGLALSSRNYHLTAKQRKIAPGLYKVITEMAEWLQKKQLTTEKILTLAELTLNNQGFHVDALHIRDADTLLELIGTSHRAIILAAAWLGGVRLIDNKVIDLTTS